MRIPHVVLATCRSLEAVIKAEPGGGPACLFSLLSLIFLSRFMQFNKKNRSFLESKTFCFINNSISNFNLKNGSEWVLAPSQQEVIKKSDVISLDYCKTFLICLYWANYDSALRYMEFHNQITDRTPHRVFALCIHLFRCPLDLNWLYHIRDHIQKLSWLPPTSLISDLSSLMN